ncbi:CHRD domain-containing protein [Herbaspirillum sp. ST 5-3]|uniref:CHRD domain-containing protein n=1 Tax=Oxalobacteraceae TaxID=75682 RepID=UPI0010A48D93|nr:CHRD domain-containing protein [Herbaspirillum sp. ST 5-3]
MKSTRVLGVTLALLSSLGSYTTANATNGASQFAARLSGFNEVPLAILSPGTGTFELSLNAGTASYTLSYSGFTTPVTEAHIHFGKKHNAGGHLVFLCSNLGNAPAGTPACPQFEGTVSGTITASQITGIEPQNFPAGDFDALVSAIVSHTTYANVHTTKFPAGEVRGQIHNTNRRDSSPAQTPQ